MTVRTIPFTIFLRPQPNCDCLDCIVIRDQLVAMVTAHGYGVHEIDGGNLDTAEVIHSHGRPVIVIHKLCPYFNWVLGNAFVSLQFPAPSVRPEGALFLGHPVFSVGG